MLQEGEGKANHEAREFVMGGCRAKVALGSAGGTNTLFAKPPTINQFGSRNGSNEASGRSITLG